MQVKHGELLPKVEQLPETSSIVYYISDNASMTVCHPGQESLGLYTLISFSIGCVIGVILFIWNNNAHSSDLALALLRSEHSLALDTTDVLVIPDVVEVPVQGINFSRQKNTSQRAQSSSKTKPTATSVEKKVPLLIRKSEPNTKPVAHSVNRAVVLARGKSFEAAEALLLSEYQRGNSNKQLLNTLGKLYSKNRKWRKAALSYSRACVSDQPDALCFYNLAVSYDHLKDREHALTAYKKAMRYYSSDIHGFDPFAIERRISELEKW